MSNKIFLNIVLFKSVIFKIILSNLHAKSILPYPRRYNVPL